MTNKHLDKFAEKAPAAASITKHLAALTDGNYTQYCAVPNPQLPAGFCERQKKIRDDAAQAALLTGDVNTLVGNSNGDIAKLRNQLSDLEDKARELAVKAPGLSSDLEAAVAKVNALNTGAHKVADGMVQLHSGIGTAAGGSGALGEGVGKLGDGAHSLDGGMFKLVDGTGELAGGLHDGVGKIPDYDQQQRDARTQVMADPVKLANQSLHKAPNYGTGFAPYFIPLSLWVGAMVAYMLIAPMNKRALAAGASPWRVALAKLAAGGRARRRAGGRADVRTPLGPRTGDGPARPHDRLPVPGHRLLRGHRPVAQRQVRRGRTDPGAGRPDAPADLGRPAPTPSRPARASSTPSTRTCPCRTSSRACAASSPAATSPRCGRAAGSWWPSPWAPWPSPRSPPAASRCGRWTGCTPN